MGWKGFAVGMIAGGARGSWIGAIAGAFIGDWIERRFFTRRADGGASPFSMRPPFMDDPLAKAYRELGVRADAPYEIIHAAYRELARKYHPDSMRSSGRTEEEISIAAAKMAKVNDAWEKIQSSRKASR